MDVYLQAMSALQHRPLARGSPLDPFAEKLAVLNFSAIKKAAERFFVKRSAAKKKLQIIITINFYDC